MLVMSRSFAAHLNSGAQMPLKHDEAVQQYSRACVGFKEKLGADHPDYVECMEEYSRILEGNTASRSRCAFCESISLLGVD